MSMQVNSGRNKEVADARGRALSGERGRGGAHITFITWPPVMALPHCLGHAATPSAGCCLPVFVCSVCDQNRNRLMEFGYFLWHKFQAIALQFRLDPRAKCSSRWTSSGLSVQASIFTLRFVDKHALSAPLSSLHQLSSLLLRAFSLCLSFFIFPWCVPYLL